MSEEIKEENVTTDEYVIIGDENFKTKSVSTGADRISFTIANIAIADAVEKFKDVTELKVSGENLEPYGWYNNLTFTSVTVYDDGLVTVAFHIAQPAELRLAALEKSQAEQDEAIAELLGGEE